MRIIENKNEFCESNIICSVVLVLVGKEVKGQRGIEGRGFGGKRGKGAKGNRRKRIEAWAAIGRLS